MSAPPDYYAILGVSPTADIAQIKKRYRELALRFHPDRNHEPSAVARIQEINNAWNVLGDAGKRAVYDAERQLLQSNRPPTAQRRPAAPQPAAAGFNGFGRTASRESADAVSFRQLFAAAVTAANSRRWSDAELFCRQALQVNPAAAAAHELMGDLYARRNQFSHASVSYAYAIQLNPPNWSVHAKMTALKGGAGPAARAAGPVFGVGVRTPHPPQTAERAAATIGAVAVASIGTFVVGILLALFTPGTPVIAGISLTLALALVLVGLSGGVLLSLGARFPPVSHEGLLAAHQRKQMPLLPPYVTLGVVAIFSFYVSAAVYFAIGSFKGSLSRFMVAAYGVALGLAALLVLLSSTQSVIGSSAGEWVVSANFVFPSLLAGWSFMDTLRAR
ncbi:MAG: DnaJ domain-containing protein [Armatimonadetes bacterium]|nr:DnaJ domain-containing protein [Armatimonadota bacterium]MDE2207875.1 DnaJ domain-containing protein [Armatimonadota bacterium]